MVRTAPIGSLAAAAALAALVLTGCGGHAEEPDARRTTLAPVPQIDPAQVRPLVGRWVGPRRDYFEFTATGDGSWNQNGQILWKGKAIPEGDNRFRFSWEGGDPKDASYWGVTLGKGELVFSGTNQKYTKAAR